MPVVKNVATENLEFGDIAAKLQKAYPFLKLDQNDIRKIKELTPTHTRRIAYDLTEANTALANGWRRIMLDEIRWPRLTCQMDAIRSDDAFCARLTDYIQNRIQLIPTGWLEEPSSAEKDDKADKEGGAKKEPTVLQLDVKNQGQQTVVIKSGEIKHVSGPKIEFDPRIDICNLMPGRMLKIHITVEWGINRTHASFSNFHGVLYRPLTIEGKTLQRDADGAFVALPPSYRVHPDGYRLGLTCETMIDPNMAAAMGWRTMVEKLERAAERISEFETRIKERGVHAMPYLTDALTVTQIRGGVIRYEFKGETLTLTNLIAWYAYINDSSITFLQPGDDHPEDPSSLIRIVHKDHAKLLGNAARAAAKDAVAILKAFK
jgi:DNA-directed RNA polymerase subunit L